MINTVYELITDVMAKQYPDRVAFRYVAADGKTVVEKTYAQYVQDIRKAIQQVRQEKGLDVILEAGAVIDGGTDVTSEVGAKLTK